MNAPASFSKEDTPATPGLADDLGLNLDDEVRRRALEALYGESFPLLQDQPELADWSAWVRNIWERHRAPVQLRLHLCKRNRLMRGGVHGISSLGLGEWREPPKPKDAARVVDNHIRPALDQRVQIVSEQRPGFHTKPENRDPAKLRKAEVQQMNLEYQYDQQDMQLVLAEMEYWAGTDGVAFCELYWDPDRGPWEDQFVVGGVDPQGNDVVQQQQIPRGDVCPHVHRIEHVRVSANASATKKPIYVVIRRPMPLAEAVAKYGRVVIEDDEGQVTAAMAPDMVSAYVQKMGYGLPIEEEMLREQQTVERYTAYLDKSEFLPKGLTLIVVGQKVVYLGPLTYGVIPVCRMTDGSTDPAYFPTPIMDSWIDSQMQINATLSKWVENVRINANPRFLAKENALSPETLLGGIMSVIGVKGLGGVNDNVRPLEGLDLAPSAIELLNRQKKAFEDLSGWNDVSRGMFTQDQSGRAILAIREQLERIFAPPVNAAARFMVDWAKATTAICAWGYDQPRMLGVTGQGRADLARYATADDFDGVMDVYIDPETLMPMPRALRLFLIKDMYAQGMMSAQEARRRMPFAFVNSINSPDEDHEARARRCVEAMRQGQWLPILWQDNEAIHQDVLERELILPDDTDPQVRQQAIQRWNYLAQQGSAKMGGPPPGPQPAPGGGGPQAQQPGQSGVNPVEQPFQGTNPSIGTPPGGLTDEGRAARQFDQQGAH